MQQRQNLLNPQPERQRQRHILHIFLVVSSSPYLSPSDIAPGVLVSLTRKLTRQMAGWLRVIGPADNTLENLTAMAYRF
ncbi:hypothetical protein AFE_0028 [Acidithiobacillus ferrooxidans ATCC 23270]|uniref:Uncharacterized protein n=1 Tax=Acidithiobacillus ferrooxidans (strain ATCC 23270 / DSM 14882 / CIP 104768 / NCIMB 8455) TaxID=243159 RepID=B7J3D0_ACIF2|nr:hypothetical protein AFE_0028 [Acidithiobacillus ferrooxidans ATCC 23270]